MSVQITVSGVSGAGKTTVARVIAGALQLVGFEVCLKDTDEHPEMHNKRVMSLKGMQVNIQTRTTCRETDK